MPRPSSPPTGRLQNLDLSSSPPSTPSRLTTTNLDETSLLSPDLPAPPGDVLPPTEEQRTAALTRELALLKSMNKTLDHLHSTLSTSRQNLGTLQTTIGASSTLLDTWTRILSQTEHNARLISDPSWEGASEDLVLAERERDEEERRTREAEQRADMERERKEREKAVSAASSGKGEATRKGVFRGAVRGTSGRGRSAVGRRGGVFRGRGRGV